LNFKGKGSWRQEWRWKGGGWEGGERRCGREVQALLTFLLGEITDDKAFSSYDIASQYRSNVQMSWKENQVLREAYQKAKEEFEVNKKKVVRKE
jgi:hypothetical protein